MSVDNSPCFCRLTRSSFVSARKNGTVACRPLCTLTSRSATVFSIPTLSYRARFLFAFAGTSAGKSTSVNLSSRTHERGTLMSAPSTLLPMPPPVPTNTISLTFLQWHKTWLESAKFDSPSPPSQNRTRRLLFQTKKPLPAFLNVSALPSKMAGKSGKVCNLEGGYDDVCRHRRRFKAKGTLCRPFQGFFSHLSVSHPTAHP